MRAPYRRRYTITEKIEAVTIARVIGQAHAARLVGVPRTAVDGWVREDRRSSREAGRET